jgi:hypothetical protein
MNHRKFAILPLIATLEDHAPYAVAATLVVDEDYATFKFQPLRRRYLRLFSFMLLS